MPAPNDALTPGAVVPGCTFPQPESARNVSIDDKKRVAKRYGLSWPLPKGTEVDHREPIADCGSNSDLNLWPEPYDGAKLAYDVLNHKDELEGYVYREIRYHGQTLAWGQAIFRGDWRHAWCQYVHQPGIICDI